MGSQHLYENYAATLYQMAGGWRIIVDDTAEFSLNQDGSVITASPYPDGSPDFLRAHLLGRVLATSLHFRGQLVLHGSAVSLAEGAVAFMAPKGSGKSTLGLALTAAGGRLLSDDAIPVVLDEQPVVWPGVHSIRMHADIAHRFAGRLPSEQRPDGKFVLTDLPDDQLEECACPLSAIYLLTPASSIASGASVYRAQLPTPTATAALVGQSKIPEMLGPGEGPELLRRAAWVASRVPVYRLAVLRDMASLSEVAAQLVDWHGGPAPVP
ncbi:MAG: hypothetical protein R2910_13505 [Gemmatimonadales bacterium]